MIKKLLLLNGTEGHKFEVGMVYSNTTDPQVVEEIECLDGNYLVHLQDNTTIEVITKNILVYYSR